MDRILFDLKKKRKLLTKSWVSSFTLMFLTSLILDSKSCLWSLSDSDTKLWWSSLDPVSVTSLWGFTRLLNQFRSNSNMLILVQCISCLLDYLSWSVQVVIFITSFRNVTVVVVYGWVCLTLCCINVQILMAGVEFGKYSEIAVKIWQETIALNSAPGLRAGLKSINSFKLIQFSRCLFGYLYRSIVSIGGTIACYQSDT